MFRLLNAVAAALFAFIVAIPGVRAQTTLELTSIYPSSFPIIGEAGSQLGPRVATLTQGALTFRFNEPGALVPATEAWDAVSIGAVDAAWYSPGYAQGIIPSSALFTAVPFGPGAPEYLAWYYYGGGQELWDEIAGRFNIKSVLCAALPPEASGWFREEITSVDQLAGKKMRIFGLGARVMEKLGVAAQTLPVGDTVPALERGTIDAAEISMPLLDLQLGMQAYAGHYYFPGWHQQTSFFSVIINTDVWNGLPKYQRATVETVCQAMVTESIAKGEALQGEPLREIEAQGIRIHTWSPAVLEAMRAAWNEVVAELSAEDEDFRRVWESFSRFRATYAGWRRLGYLPAD